MYIYLIVLYIRGLLTENHTSQDGGYKTSFEIYMQVRLPASVATIPFALSTTQNVVLPEKLHYQRNYYGDRYRTSVFTPIKQIKLQRIGKDKTTFNITFAFITINQTNGNQMALGETNH